MQRVLLVGLASLGLADAYRINPKRSAVVDDSLAQASQTNETAARSSWCLVSGDPHITTFDQTMRRARRWDPLFSAGYWWLVRSEERKIEIQAVYGDCGRKGQGGWMALRKDNRPRSCMRAIAVGGSFLDGIANAPLVIQVPCDWDWDNSKCKTDEKKAIIWWNKERVDSVKAEGVSVTSPKRWHYTVKLPQGVEIHVSMTGAWVKGISPTYMNAKIHMTQGTAGGEQCGHCGNFDGDHNNDRKYDVTGRLMDKFRNTDPKLGGTDLCEPEVECEDRLIPQTAGCERNRDEGGSKPECPEDVKQKVREKCIADRENMMDPKLVGMGGAEWEEGQLEECIEDGCADEAFIDDDVEDAEEEDEDVFKKPVD